MQVILNRNTEKLLTYSLLHYSQDKFVSECIH